VRHVVLDVTDDASVAAARALIETESGRLDVLVNNAGVAGRHAPVEETTPADFLPVFGVNVLGPVRVLGAFVPLLRRSAQPRVVMVSSGMGSLAITSDPDRLESTLVSLVYPSSKTALNMITTQYAKGLPGFQINAADPGYTATDLNGFRGTQTVEQAAEPIVHLATLPPDGPTGSFFGVQGPLPW
jgi:NAD(P)-dependent dehydrogenase (short-subunit alcohol dehydrogenase family)